MLFYATLKCQLGPISISISLRQKYTGNIFHLCTRITSGLKRQILSSKNHCKLLIKHDAVKSLTDWWRVSESFEMWNRRMKRGGDWVHLIGTLGIGIAWKPTTSTQTEIRQISDQPIFAILQFQTAKTTAKYQRNCKPGCSESVKRLAKVLKSGIERWKEEIECIWLALE